MVDVAAVAHGQQALKALEDSAALKVAVLNVKRALVSLAVEVLECADLRCAAGERGVRLIVGHRMTVCELALVPSALTCTNWPGASSSAGASSS